MTFVNCENHLTGSFDIVRARSFGVKIGLGTDCSGGYHPSILDAMRQDFVYSLLIALDILSDLLFDKYHLHIHILENLFVDLKSPFTLLSNKCHNIFQSFSLKKCQIQHDSMVNEGHFLYLLP